MKEKERRERNRVIRLVSGDLFKGVEIESQKDYFDRERRENNIEQGIPEIMPELVGSDVEYIIKKNNRDMSYIENKRAGGSMIKEKLKRSWPEPEDRRSLIPRQGKIDYIEL